jgi:hypothetical protein
MPFSVKTVLFAFGCFSRLAPGPPLQQLRFKCSIAIIFERELRPLSSELPSPAINACELSPVILAEEGTKD